MGIKFVLDILYEGSSIGAAGLYDDSGGSVKVDLVLLFNQFCCRPCGPSPPLPLMSEKIAANSD